MNFHGPEVRQKALTLLRDGVSNREVARRMGIPLGTIGYWLHMDRAKRGECPGKGPSRPCPRCDGRELDEAAYAYLLGLYLGDGHISQHVTVRVPSLSITCSDTWPGLMDECETAMRGVFPDNSVCRVRRSGCADVKLYSKHLYCLFPQHGPGKKHDRPIVLADWQRDIVAAHPWELVRGLIHSDGCRITNWATRTVGGETKRYEYPRYFFTNKSADILRLFTGTLDNLGVEWRKANARNISVAKKASVALMDTHVGPKY